MISGAAYVVKALQEEQVEFLFNYPGAATIDIMDELYKQDQVKVILPRHEQALAHAADGYARSTGRVGVCMVTSGPGATNLVTGIATAYSDSVPMVCITGQVDLSLMGNDAFQEVDTVGIVRNVCKYAVTVRDRKDLGRILKEAFYIARTGRPGPVVVDIPKNIQKAMGSDVYPTEVNIRGYKPNETVHIGQIKKACSIISKAKRPLFLLGGGISISGANDVMTELVDKTGIPVVTTLMGKGAISSRHPLYLGNVGIHGGYAPNVALTDCDVMISIGTRFNDRITGKLSTFAQNCKIVHIDVDAASISKNIKVDIPIVADAKLAIEKLLEYMEPHDLGDWSIQLQQLKEAQPVTQSDIEGLTPERVIQYINNHYDRPIVATDVGQNQLWTTQFLEIDGNHQLLTSGGLGTMGYGFPAALGAQMGNLEARVFAICGDGGVQMNIQEFATAMHYHLPMTLIILNNGYLGNVRQWQQLFYDKRYACTNLLMDESAIVTRESIDNGEFEYVPNFVQLAQAYGAQGIRITKVEELEDAFTKADNFKQGPTLIECIIPTEINVMPMVPAGKSLSDMMLKDKK
ncbi:biosynthetic-type acetolactate synthase large subunit [Veillonella caviae]|uniref:biosynthetic-type acetolactate synthase large subunit n=1 Tax=Veillonella caviae TaxID=248316 RepID=UPI0023F035A7|nr:biosynthetic-type acetolactate synthase large subunit [Veillonella caviae]MCI6408100.1 biosynthetic-type acetolactate synthase large subunit [Veillonella caviae]MDY6224439.1 biosynthetic-type acetolactate synthase large subunit [Veillonella caviae]